MAPSGRFLAPWILQQELQQVATPSRAEMMQSRLVVRVHGVHLWRPWDFPWDLPGKRLQVTMKINHHF